VPRPLQRNVRDRISRKAGWLALAVLFAVQAWGYAAGWTVQAEGRIVWLETERWKIGIEDGLVVDFTNKLAGEVHARRGASVDSLPAGLGVQTGALEAARQLHALWGGVALDRKPAAALFPSQHRPYAKSAFTWNRVDARTVCLTYRGLAVGDKVYPDETFKLTAALDAATGDILLTASGSSRLGGVYGAMVGVANIDKNTTAQVAHFGGVRLDKDWPRGQYSLQDGGPFWEAPMVALEGTHGSWAMWSADARFGPKGFYWQNTPGAFHLLMESRNLSPFDAYHEVKTVTWHMNCFRGSWVAAAKPYHEWFGRAFAEDLAARTPDWARKIRVVCECLPTGPAEMDALAAVFDPRTVLLHAWSARKPEFDHELPDFTPRQTFIDCVQAAHQRGFHTSGYVNAYCVNKGSPSYRENRVEDTILVRTPLFQAKKTLADWKDGQLIYGDPLSRPWREFHARSMKAFVDASAVDSLYEDTAGCSGDFGNGMAEEVYAGRGSYELLRGVRRLLPAMPFSTEYNTEPIAPFCTWPLRGNYLWGGEAFRDALSTHASPLEAYLFGPDVLAWVMVHPTSAPQHFHRAVDYADAMGGLAWVYSPAWLNVTRGDEALALHRAKLFSRLQLKPVFPETKWEPGVMCYYSDSAGRIYKVVEASGQALVGSDGRDLYRRTRGLRRVTTGLVIPGWPAYDAVGPIGLNPAVKYSLVPPAESPERTWPRLSISALSPDAYIDSYREGDGFVSLTLGHVPGSQAATVSLTYTLTNPCRQVLVNGLPAHSETAGRNFVLSFPRQSSVLWIDRAAEMPHDGYLGSGTEEGQMVAEGLGLAVDVQRRKLLRFRSAKGPCALTVCPSSGVELVLDYLVKVPDAASVVRVFGLHSKEKYGDGMTAKIFLNGRPIFTTPMPRDEGRWHQWDIPLGTAAGQPALITLVANCNRDTNCDNLRLTRPRIVEDSSVKQPQHQTLESAK